MPTREVLAPAERSQFSEIPAAMIERDLARYSTSSPDELAIIRQRRRPHNRLGFAIQLGYLSFPGRPLHAVETVPAPVLTSMAAQLELDAGLLDVYARERDTTRREHVQQSMQLFGFRPFDWRAYREIAGWLLPTALSTDSGTALVAAVIDELRTRRIVALALYLIERLAWETRRRASRRCGRRSTGATPCLLPETRRCLRGWACLPAAGSWRPPNPPFRR